MYVCVLVYGAARAGLHCEGNKSRRDFLIFYVTAYLHVIQQVYHTTDIINVSTMFFDEIISEMI